jgi:Family of unknown function (DUF5706)
MLGRRDPSTAIAPPGETGPVRTRGAYSPLEYARGVHSEVHTANRDLYTRAQIVLTIDGVVLAAVAAAVAGRPDDLAETVNVFGATTWAALGVAGAALVASVFSSALALYARHMQGTRPSASGGAYEPANMWFFRHVAEHDPVRYVEVAAQADESFETRARLAQVTIMAPIVVRRAQWVNRAFAFTALSFTFFALAAADYLIRLAD